MKKIILTMVLMVGISSASLFANSNPVSSKVLAAFKKEFKTAQDVQWYAGSNFYRAAFKINEQNVFAFYTLDGELSGVARYVSSLQLPIGLLTNLKNDYSQYWVTDLFEVNNKEGVHYYITLEDAETVLKLSSSNGSEWKFVEKNKKI